METYQKVIACTIIILALLSMIISIAVCIKSYKNYKIAKRSMEKARQKAIEEMQKNIN